LDYIYQGSCVGHSNSITANGCRDGHSSRLTSTDTNGCGNGNSNRVAGTRTNGSRDGNGFGLGICNGIWIARPIIPSRRSDGDTDEHSVQYLVSSVLYD